MTILIIEDEEPTARKLQRLLSDVLPDDRVVGMTGSVDESVEWLQTHPQPDLIFMDIELADGQSFEIFNRVAVSSPIIFTTAYDEYAIKAFKVNSIDYLLKPVKEADLRQAVDKLRRLKEALADGKSPSGTPTLEASLTNLLQHLQATRLPEPAPHTVTAVVRDSDRLPPMPAAVQPRDRFMIKQGQRLFSVGIEEVAYFFSRNKLSFLKTRDEHEWLVDYTLDELVQMLDPRRFFRLNRQVIAELRSVDKVHLYFNGKLKINLRPVFEDEVVVSREKAGELKLWLGE